MDIPIKDIGDIPNSKYTHPETNLKVKLFVCDEKCDWNDKGTGFLKLNRMEDGYEIEIIDEQDNFTRILHSKLSSGKDYRLERGTIISWFEEEMNSDIAISFQDSESAGELFEVIHNEFGVSQEESISEEIKEETVLPEPSMDSVSIIVNELSETLTLSKKAKILSICMKNGNEYLKKLYEVFKKAELTKNQEVLTLMFIIFKSLILLADSKLIEVLLYDDHFAFTMGILEYDTSNNLSSSSESYRKLIDQKIKFKNITGIDDIEIIKKIHMNFRLLFLKDTAAARWLDEITLSVIITKIYTNYYDIITFIFNRETSAKKILEGLKSESIESKSATSAFLIDICYNSKQLQIEKKVDFFINLINNDILNVLIQIVKPSDILLGLNANKSDDKLKIEALEILTYILQGVPS